jgi:myo-inositol catabolism protein IolS
MQITKDVPLRSAGTSDLQLSVLGLGCWSFGGGQYWGNQDQAEVNAVVRRAVELGINYFDTAEVYNDGRSEESLGIAIRGLPRDKLIIGTKISPNNVARGILGDHCEASLRRLGLDYIDLYMVHWPITLHSIRHFDSSMDVCPPVEEAFEGLMRLQRQEKVRYVGVSNFAPHRIEEALASGLTVTVNEVPYNLLCRAAEWEVMPWCKRKGIGVVGYMALLQGILADIFPTLDDVPVWRRRTRHFDCRKCKEVRHGELGAEQETEAALNVIREISKEVGLPMSQVAMKWAIANSAITCELAGARRVIHLEENVFAASEPLPIEVIEQLNSATQPLMEKLGRSFDYYETAQNDRTQ